MQQISNATPEGHVVSSEQAETINIRPIRVAAPDIMGCELIVVSSGLDDPCAGHISVTLSLIHPHTQAELAVLMFEGSLASNPLAREHLQSHIRKLECGEPCIPHIAALESLAREHQLHPRVFYPKFQKDFVHASIPEDLSRTYPCDPDLTLAELEAVRAAGETSIETPLNIRDRRTLLRRGIMLESEQGVAQLNACLPGPKALVFFDFNAMGAVDRAGLVDAIDNILICTHQCALRAFGKNIPHEVISLGGDEFAVACSWQGQGAGAQAALRTLFDEVRRISAFNLNPYCGKSPRIGIQAPLSRAREWAEMKSALRSVRHEFMKTLKQEQSAFSIGCYHSWLGDELQSSGGTAAPQHDCGTRAVQLAALWTKNGDSRLSPLPQLLSVTHSSPVLLTENARVEEWRAALRTAQSQVSERKIALEGRYNLDPVLPGEPGCERRTSARSGMEQLEELLQESSRAGALLNSLRTCAGVESLFLKTLAERSLDLTLSSHPYMPHVAHSEHVAGSRAARQFVLEARGADYTALYFDISHFGALNHVLGYHRADDIVRELGTYIQGALPPAYTVRAGGGGLIFLIKGEIEETSIRGVQNLCLHRLRELMQDERVEAEIRERSALTRWFGDNGTAQVLAQEAHELERDLLEISVSISRHRVGPDTKLHDLLPKIRSDRTRHSNP